MSRRHNHYKHALAMTDRERLLTVIASSITPYTQDSRYQNFNAAMAGVYWANAIPGDLVLTTLRHGTDRWNWAWLRQHGKHIHQPSCWAKGDLSQTQGDWPACRLLQDIASNSYCHMGNASCVALRGIPPEQMLIGQQYKFWVKVQKAFWEIDAYAECKCAGIAFATRGARRATIGVRPHMFSRPSPAEPAGQRWVVQPITFDMDFDSKTSIKKIVARIRASGPWDWGAALVLAPGKSGSMCNPVVATTQEANNG